MRSPGLDALRGLAVVLMLVDHVLLLVDPVSPARLITRAAMPLFFLIAGHLASWRPVRLVLCAAWGLVLPLLLPWLDAPNVLTLYAAGVPLVLVLERIGKPAVAVLVAIALTIGANGWAAYRGGYDPASVLALLALGRLMPLREWVDGGEWPKWLQPVGQRPLVVYVGHLLIFWGVLRAD